MAALTCKQGTPKPKVGFYTLVDYSYLLRGVATEASCPIEAVQSQNDVDFVVVVVVTKLLFYITSWF